MQINSGNILDVIRFLYRKKFAKEADEEILTSWSNLTDGEAQDYLNQLLDSWGYDNIQKSATYVEIEKILNKNEVVIPPFIPEIKEPDISQPPLQPIQTRKKGYKWIWLLPLVALLYVGYKYYEFKNFTEVYVITDNVAIRNHDGKIIGRMDIFPKNGAYSNLKTTGFGTYPVTIDNKIYNARRVVLDKVSFVDYLLNKPDAFGYVNENYLIDDKKKFDIYQNVFKEINKVKHENTALPSFYRKLIVGCLEKNPSLSGLYIKTSCGYAGDAYSSIIMHKANEHSYQVVAKLSDGFYYIFSGNPDDNMYKQPVYFDRKEINSEEMNHYSSTDILFKKIGESYFLYGCGGAPTDYYTVFNQDNEIQYAKYAYDF